MSKNFKKLKNEFARIKEMGYVETHRRGDTGVGKTFEDLLGKKEDNLAAPDYKDIEIKSQREATASMITLFTKSPDFPKKVNTLLREAYGNPSMEHGGKKILHTTINAVNFNTHVSGYDFKILIDYDLRRLVLQVREHRNNRIVFDNAYWTFDNIEHRLNTKLKNIACVSAKEKKKNGKTYFKYTDMILVTGLTMNKFLKALEKGDIMVDIRIGVYHKGKNDGKTHDHGTAFRMMLNKLLRYAESEAL